MSMTCTDVFDDFCVLKIKEHVACFILKKKELSSDEVVDYRDEF